MGIVELLTRIGDENIKFQNLVNDMTDIALPNGASEVTFATDPRFISPNHVATGSVAHVALVLWLPKDLVQKAKAAGK